MSTEESFIEKFDNQTYDVREPFYIKYWKHIFFGVILVFVLLCIVMAFGASMFQSIREGFMDFSSVNGIDTIKPWEPEPSHNVENSEQQLADSINIPYDQSIFKVCY